MEALEKHSISNGTNHAVESDDLVEAVIISGPQKGRIVQLRSEELENAISPMEKKALEELFTIQNEYWTRKGDAGAREEMLHKMDELKEKYRELV